MCYTAYKHFIKIFKISMKNITQTYGQSLKSVTLFFGRQVVAMIYHMQQRKFCATLLPKECNHWKIAICYIIIKM